MQTKTRVAAIIIKQGKILMLIGRGYKELWTPGGKIKEGESDEECLKRELQEEIGAKLVSMKYFGEYSGQSPYHHRITRNKVYLAEIDGEIHPGHEIESFIWYNRDDFENNQYPMIPLDKERLIPDLIKNDLF